MTFIEWLENEGGAAKVAITIKMYVENKPKRGPGSDKVNIGQYINQGAINKEFIDSEAAAIYRRLVKSTDKTTTGYFFSPFLKTEISKGDSTDETRPVAQATVRDASVQKLLLEYIELNGPTPYRHSYAYQKNKSAKDAVKYIRNLIKDEYKWIFDADLSKYFDTIPHNGLIRLIKTHFPNDPQLESLTFRYLKSYIRPSPKGFGNKAVRKLVGKSRSFKATSCIDRTTELRQAINKKFIGKPVPIKFSSLLTAKRNSLGVPQGGILSGYLANLYLNSFDECISSIDGIKYVRYADDFIVLAKDEDSIRNVVPVCQQEMEKLGLIMHDIDSNKSRLCPESSFDGSNIYGFKFLGFIFSNGTISAKPESVKKLENQLKTLVIYNKLTPPGRSKPLTTYSLHKYDEASHTFKKAGKNSTRKPNIKAVYLSKNQYKQKDFSLKNYLYAIYEIFKEEADSDNIQKNKQKYSWLTYFELINKREQINYIAHLLYEVTKGYYYMRYSIRLTKEQLLRYRPYPNHPPIFIKFHKLFYRFRKDRNKNLENLFQKEHTA